MPLVLDLDGVIIESNTGKNRAMLALFEDRRREYAAIDAYIRAHNGVRRDHKLRHIVSEILRLAPSDDVLADYLTRYERVLERSLAEAPLVPGVDALLARGEHVFYVSSTAPDREVREQLSRRGLTRYFAQVFGASTPKADALEAVSGRHPDAAAVFFGDSLGDWEAARRARVAFVAVTSECDNFPGLPVVKLRDFASAEAVRESIARALRQGGA